MDFLNFKSYSFIFFLITSIFVYYTINKKWQWMILLLANTFFYITSGFQNIFFIITTAFSVFLLAKKVEILNQSFKDKKSSGNYTKDELKIEKNHILKSKRCLLLIAVTINFGILAFLKYWNAIMDFFELPLHAGGTRGLILPLGISFYTFQTIAYFMDVYNGKYESEKSFLRFFTFVSFFPQLIMGPINRYDSLGKQMRQVHEFKFENFKKGIFLILFGAMKKYCIADLLYMKISSIFDNHYTNIPGALILTGILFYSIYQYADFSGGIDMILGFAKMFDIDLAPNFRQPYFATSLGDFWRRWHISLGAWMKDYVFYPFALTKKMQNLSKKILGMKNKNLGKHLARTIPAGIGNILVFLIVGIWHGSEMHFVIWGLYNGIVIALSDLLKPIFEKLNEILHLPVKSKGFKFFQIIRTFIIVNIGWYFDRIIDVGESFVYLKQTFTSFGPMSLLSNKDYLKMIFGSLKSFDSEFTLVLISGIIVLVTSILKENKIDVYDSIQSKNIVIRWLSYYVPMILIILSLSFAPGTPIFMYAQY